MRTFGGQVLQVGARCGVPLPVFLSHSPFRLSVKKLDSGWEQ